MTSRTLVTSKSRPSFKQQNLPAWQPILTAGTVLPTFFLIGVAFVPIGIGLLTASNKVQEISIDYTDCISDDSARTCASIAPQSGCSCSIRFELKQDLKKEVYVYYGLSNFYQNHRRYVKSRDDLQLLGNPKSISSDCYPFDMAKDPNDHNKTKPIAPCGAIANSKFNDTFKLQTSTGLEVQLRKDGIAWPSDKLIRFRNPPVNSSDPKGLERAFEGTVKPPYWREPVFKLHLGDKDNNGFQNEDLIVWMRTAALPTFRKLYGRVKFDDDEEYMPKGNYTLKIEYNYPVSAFNGQKRFIISTTSWLGGKNNFLGIAYIVVGCACFILSAFFLFIHKKYATLPSEITQINQSTPYLASS